MIRPVEDLDAIAGPYLDGLNLSFPGWGDARMFDWCFRRAVGAPPADLFVVEEEGVLIAGSAVTYRRLRRGDGAVEPVGCMTGSWTLPAARGRGLFKQMIAVSLDQARAQGCRLLVGFGAAANASYSSLAAVAADVVEAAFLTSPDAGPERPALPEAPIGHAEAAFAARSFEPDVGHIVYEPGQWLGQMIGRPGPTRTLDLGSGLFAVVEPRGSVDRLLDVSTADPAAFVAAVERAAAAGRSAGRSLSTYSVDPEVIAELTRRGYASTPACYYLLQTRDEPLPRERWWFANGDRM